MNDLFQVSEKLSPRLEWIRLHGIVIYRSAPKGAPVEYMIGMQVWWPGLSGADFFAEEAAMYSDARMGTGSNERDAIWNFCRKNKIKHYDQ